MQWFNKLREQERPKHLIDLQEKARSGTATAQLQRRMYEVLEPHITTTLAGLVYAYYTDPEDLFITADPLLVRKHTFIRVRPEETGVGFSEAELQQNDLLGVTHVSGSFYGFASLVGHMAASTLMNTDPDAQPAMAAQIAAIRGTNWGRISGSDLDQLSTTVHAAREWIHDAASDDDLYRALEQATIGHLPTARRCELLRGVTERDWPSVWRCVTTADLYSIGRVIPMNQIRPLSLETNAAVGDDSAHTRLLRYPPKRWTSRTSCMRRVSQRPQSVPSPTRS